MPADRADAPREDAVRGGGWPLATDEERKLGWTYSVDFLSRIADAVDTAETDDFSVRPSLETVEGVMRELAALAASLQDAVRLASIAFDHPMLVGDDPFGALVEKFRAALAAPPPAARQPDGAALTDERWRGKVHEFYTTDPECQRLRSYVSFEAARDEATRKAFAHFATPEPR